MEEINIKSINYSKDLRTVTFTWDKLDYTIKFECSYIREVHYGEPEQIDRAPLYEISVYKNGEPATEQKLGLIAYPPSKDTVKENPEDILDDGEYFDYICWYFIENTQHENLPKKFDEGFDKFKQNCAENSGEDVDDCDGWWIYPIEKMDNPDFWQSEPVHKLEPGEKIFND